jgi:hypothetical protein
VNEAVDIFREGLRSRRRQDAVPIRMYGKALKDLSDIEFDMALHMRPCENCGDEALLNGSGHEEWCPMHEEFERRGGIGGWKRPAR